MKILGLNFRKKQSTELIVIEDESEKVYDSYALQKKRAMLVLIAVLTVIRDITNDEIKGRCKMLYDFGRMGEMPIKTNTIRCLKLQSELENDYPFIHSWSDKDRESATIEESQEKINQAMRFVFSGGMRTGMSFRSVHEMTRQERESNNKSKSKKLPKGYYLLSPQPGDNHDNDHEQDKSEE